MTGMRRDGSMVTTLSGLYAYIFCMMASSALTGMPIFGGALFMCGRVAAVFFDAFRKDAPLIPQGIKRWRTALLALMLLINICLVVVYPISLGAPKLWVLFALVLAMILRDGLGRRLIRREAAGLLKPGRYMRRMALIYGAALLAMAAVLLYNLPPETGFALLGGFVLCSVLAAYSMNRERLTGPESSEAPVSAELAEPIRSANAIVTFERLSMMVSMALEMTLVLLYTYLAVTAEQLLAAMVLAVCTTLLFREGAEWLLRRRERKRLSDPTNIMLLGLAMWLAVLWLFGRTFRAGMPGVAYTNVCLGLCSAGAALCMTCLQRMDEAVSNAAEFAAGHRAHGYDQLRAAGQEMSQLLGRMLALCTLTVLCFVTGSDLPRDMHQLAARFQPVMVLPAVLTVIAAIISMLRFPLSGRYIHKLARFLNIRRAGGENPALEKQLEAVVLRQHRQPFGTRLMMAVLRPFFRHTLKGTENIVQDENNPIVFLCNHGEIYGPVSAMLYIPVPVRPWVISEIVVSAEEVAQYLYKWTLSPITWLGPARWWLARLCGPIAVWGMRQLEAIPVFRNKPRELMTTFRRSVEAMEAGDNLLIFPENPDAAEVPGYAHGCMGELFRGFPMLAQVYYNRTGKKCRFLPMYAHKGMRTLSFGEAILFDPENDPITERDRIVDAAAAQMEGLFRREEALYRQKK